MYQKTDNCIYQRCEKAWRNAEIWAAAQPQWHSWIKPDIPFRISPQQKRDECQAGASIISEVQKKKKEKNWGGNFSNGNSNRARA